MKNPFLLLGRKLALRRHRSTTPTSLLPLHALHGALVFVEISEEEDDPERIARAVRQFFDYQGIPVRIISPRKEDLNLLGFRKKHIREADGPRQEDLFVSLAASPENFAAEFEARCSPARFKVGRCDFPDGVFDLVVAGPEDRQTSQAAAFAAIKDYLNKIR